MKPSDVDKYMHNNKKIHPVVIDRKNNIPNSQNLQQN